MNRQEQIRKAAAIQRKWRADALRDAKYNQNRARINRALGNTVLAHMYAKESVYDVEWANRRAMWSNHPIHMMYPRHLHLH